MYLIKKINQVNLRPVFILCVAGIVYGLLLSAGSGQEVGDGGLIISFGRLAEML